MFQCRKHGKKGTPGFEKTTNCQNEVVCYLECHKGYKNTRCVEYRNKIEEEKKQAEEKKKLEKEKLAEEKKKLENEKLVAEKQKQAEEKQNSEAEELKQKELQ